MKRGEPQRCPTLVGQRHLVAVAAILLFGGEARADVIFLRTGEQVVGTVFAEDATKVIFDSAGLGRIEIPRGRIERIERDASSGTAAFVPPAPVGTTTTNATAVVPTTNPPAGRRCFGLLPPPQKLAGADWIQLKSGEWLRGKLDGMQNRTLEFDSDELDEMTFDWKDIAQVVSPRAFVSYGEREAAAGLLRVDRHTVTVSGDQEIRIPREALIGITPGERRELDYWSGKFNVGLNARAGNTEQADMVAKFKIERRTPITHLKLEYTANYAELEGVENVNNQHGNLYFDLFLTRRFFLRMPYADYYHDPFQNIDRRFTIGGGVGYYLIDRPMSEWLVVGGPGYQHTTFASVEAGEEPENSTPALFLGSHFEVQLSKRADFELSYQGIITSEEAGLFTQHAEAVLEIDLTRRLDLDLSLTWDRIQKPQPSNTGEIPEQDDFRISLSLGVKF